LSFGSDVDALEDRLVEDAALQPCAVAVDLSYMVQPLERDVEGFLDVFELRGGLFVEALGGFALGLELVLLGREDVFGDEVAVIELDQLFLLALDRLQGPFVPFGLLLDDGRALS
jgi:hypothetical protein